MLFSLAIIFIMGFFMADIFSRLKLPRIIGMIITGIIICSYVLDLLDPSILGISSDCTYNKYYYKCNLSQYLEYLQNCDRLHL